MKGTEKAISPSQCPLWDAGQELADVNADLKRMLRRLRRDLKRCERCPNHPQVESDPECPELSRFHRQVEEAIRLVNEELAIL